MRKQPCSERRVLWERFRQALTLYIEGKRSRSDFEREWDVHYQHLVTHGCRNELLPSSASNCAQVQAPARLPLPSASHRVTPTGR